MVVQKSFSNSRVSSLRLPSSNIITKHTRKIVLVGPPGVGKSTYAKILSNKWRNSYNNEWIVEEGNTKR